MKKIYIVRFLIFTLLPIIISNYCMAQSESIQKICAHARTPRDISQCLSGEFVYSWEIPDRWQSTKETIALKKGDCEDFAVLSQALLAREGIRCEIAIVKFKKLNISHAICIWKDRKYYSFMSNQKFYNTRKDTLEKAVERVYPDWEKVFIVDSKKNLIKTIRKK